MGSSNSRFTEEFLNIELFNSVEVATLLGEQQQVEHGLTTDEIRIGGVKGVASTKIGDHGCYLFVGT